MLIETAEDYQQALMLLESLQQKGTTNLTIEEKQQSRELMRALESYHFRNDPVTRLAAIA
jgi:hypothetical protein